MKLLHRNLLLIDMFIKIFLKRYFYEGAYALGKKCHIAKRKKGRSKINKYFVWLNKLFYIAFKDFA